MTYKNINLDNTRKLSLKTNIQAKLLYKLFKTVEDIKKSCFLRLEPNSKFDFSTKDAVELAFWQMASTLQKTHKTIQYGPLNLIY